MVCMHKFYTRPCPTLLISSFWRPAAFRTVSTGNKHCSNRLELSDSKRALQTKQRKNHIKGKGKKKACVGGVPVCLQARSVREVDWVEEKSHPPPPQKLFSLTQSTNESCLKMNGNACNAGYQTSAQINLPLGRK